jgi:RNA recognition motif-containing protein
VTKLFVGNLPFSATEESVRALFAPHGTIESLALISDRDTGRPRGFGFIEMSNADAAKAMQALNGKNFRVDLKVNEAQARERSGGGGGTARGKLLIPVGNAAPRRQRAPGLIRVLI